MSAGIGGKSVELPGDYPKDLVPIFPGAKILMAGKTDKMFGIQIYTEKSIPEVYEYYVEAMKNAEGLRHDQGDNFFDVEGVKGEYWIFLGGMINEIEGKNMTVVNIHLEKE